MHRCYYSIRNALVTTRTYSTYIVMEHFKQPLSYSACGSCKSIIILRYISHLPTREVYNNLKIWLTKTTGKPDLNQKCCYYTLRWHSPEHPKGFGIFYMWPNLIFHIWPHRCIHPSLFRQTTVCVTSHTHLHAGYAVRSNNYGYSFSLRTTMK